ncbi:hypothetical protein ABZP36_023108 [Zizania latifolia]
MEAEASGIMEAVAAVIEEGGTAAVDVGAMGLVLALGGKDVATVSEAIVDPPADESAVEEAAAGAVVKGDVAKGGVP